ncbi:MAG: hypothetical protein ABI353_13280 [Isosphaeraceae bacterium]
MKARRVQVRVEDLESRFLLSGLDTRPVGAGPVALSVAIARNGQVAEVSDSGFAHRIMPLTGVQVAAIDAGTAVTEMAGIHDRLENAQRLPNLDRTQVFGTLDTDDKADLYKLTIHPGTRSIQVDCQWGTALTSPPARLRLLNEQGEVHGDQPMTSRGASTLFTLDQSPESETTLYMAVVRDPDEHSAVPADNVPISAPYDLAILFIGQNPDTGQGNNPTFPGGTGQPGNPVGGSGQLELPTVISIPDVAPGYGYTSTGASPVTTPVSSESVAPGSISLPISPSDPASGLFGSHRPAPTYTRRDTSDVDLNLVNAPTAPRVPSPNTPETTTDDDETDPSVVDLDTTLSIALDALFGATDAGGEGETSPWRPTIPTKRTAHSGGPLGLPPLVGSVWFGRRDLGVQTQDPTANVASLPPLDSLPKVELSSATPDADLADRGMPATSISIGHIHTLRHWAMAASLFGSAALMFSLYAPDLRSVMNDAQRNQKLKDVKTS